MEELLKEIAKNTRHKSSSQIILSSDKTDFQTRFNPPIELDKNVNYEIALVNLETYYSFPNITNKNSKFTYSHDSGTTWTEITIPTGCYELSDLNRVIQENMQRHGHWDRQNEKYYISLGANTATLKCVMNVSHNYRVDFTVENSLNAVLGFENLMYGEGYHESENTVNILNINSILVNIDIVRGSYVNGGQTSVIYSFFPNVSPGHKIVETPVNLVYLPIILDSISKITTTITDNNGKLLDLRNETITMRFHIREI